MHFGHSSQNDKKIHNNKLQFNTKLHNAKIFKIKAAREHYLIWSHEAFLYSHCLHRLHCLHHYPWHKNKTKNFIHILKLLHILNNTLIFNSKAFSLEAFLWMTIRQDNMWFSLPQQWQQTPLSHNNPKKYHPYFSITRLPPNTL